LVVATLLTYPLKLLSTLRGSTAHTESKLSNSNILNSDLKLENSWFLSLFHFLFIWFVFENTNLVIKYDAIIVVNALDLNHNYMLSRKSRNNIQAI